MGLGSLISGIGNFVKNNWADALIGVATGAAFVVGGPFGPLTAALTGGVLTGLKDGIKSDWDWGKVGEGFTTGAVLGGITGGFGVAGGAVKSMSKAALVNAGKSMLKKDAWKQAGKAVASTAFWKNTAYDTYKDVLKKGRGTALMMGTYAGMQSGSQPAPIGDIEVMPIHVPTAAVGT